MKHNLWAGKYLEEGGRLKVRHEPWGNGEFRKNMSIKISYLCSYAPHHEGV